MATSFRTTSLRRLSSVRSTRTNSGFKPGFDLVLEAAHAYPKEIAVRSFYDANEHTYEELEQDALGLAAYLQSLGAGVGSRVALAFDRSYDLMVALLGIWLSGAAYVALDANYPGARRCFRFWLQILRAQAGMCMCMTDTARMSCHAFRGAHSVCPGGL